MTPRSSNEALAHKKSGFTLIELSIALVIIGLIVGGVLVGQDLIRAASMRAQVSQIEQIKTAINTFRLKYNCIPGDCATATNFFGGASQPEQVTNGNGDGKVCDRPPYLGAANSCNHADTNAVLTWGIYDSGVTYGESSMFFDHLAASGLINLSQYDEGVVASNQAGIGFPLMKFQGSGVQASTGFGSVGGVVAHYMKGYLYMNEGHKLSLGGCGGAGGQNMGFYCGMTGVEAYQFDSKIDDGLPLSGIAKIHSMLYILRVPGDVNNELSNACNTIGTENLYNISYNDATSNNRYCNIAVDAGF